MLSLVGGVLMFLSMASTVLSAVGTATKMAQEGGPGSGLTILPSGPPPSPSEHTPPAALPAPPASEDEFDTLMGQSLDAVYERLGRPVGTVKQGSRVVWMYDGFSVTSLDGKTVGEVDTQAGATMPVPMPGATVAPPRPEASAVVRTISDGGKKVDLKDLVVPGRITLVDFYADWCGPCRTMAPHLEQLANQDKDVFLRKVDIVKWGTPVTKQYAISSVPNVRVFDRTGRQVGEPTYSLSQIKAYIDKSK